ncbi:MAG: EamA family transporter [Candidatus Promineifilaceae bacterium]|nr:EamA family transporter [Candidatus Promineifilaceae bacterium]
MTNKYLNPAGGGWFIIMAAVLWGTTGTAQALTPPGTQSMTVGTMRLLLGAITLSIIAAYRKELGSLRKWRSWPLVPTMLAAAGVALYQIFFFAAVKRTGVAVGTIVGIGSTPVAAGILVYLRHREAPGRVWMLSTALAILGCALLILTGSSIEIDVVGIFLAFAAGTSYALYTMMSKELLDKHPAGAVVTLTFWIGVFILLPILLVGDLSWLLVPRGLVVAVYLGVVTVGVAYFLFMVGLSTVSVANAATLTLAEPVTAAILGIAILSEQLSWVAIIGIALILCGLVLLTLDGQKMGKAGQKKVVRALKPGLMIYPNSDDK